jgi:hypothetical protein
MFVSPAAITVLRCVQRLPRVEAKDFATALCSETQVQSASDHRRLIDIS